MHINLNKPTASYDDATLNEKGMIPKVKGGVVQPMGVIGSLPCVDHPFNLFCLGAVIAE